MASWSWLTVSLCYLVLINSSVCGIPIVCIDNHGCIEGTTVQSNISDEPFEAFYGIPYAQPPIGDLRFRNPVPSNWTGNITATQPTEQCIQKFIVFPNANVSGVEDCLYLNVLRPNIDLNATRLPVIIWIHGGGFFAGSPTSDGPQLFLNTKEVIWVSMAYRLGVLGFLSTGDEHSPGNYGLKDQSLALRWVRDNIDAFGGNTTSITLMGVSAGAAAVHMHMMSPLSQGLFERAIVMSGSALAPYNNPVSDPLAQAMQQAQLLGISATNSQNLIAQLRDVEAYALVDHIEGMKFWDLDPLTTYKLAIEANITGAFMIEHPLEISRNGNYLHVPWITGLVEHEGAVRAATIVSNQTLLADLNTQLSSILPLLMEIQIENEGNIAEIVQRILDKYLNGSSVITEANDQRLIDMYSDRAFLYPCYKMSQHYVQYADTNQMPLSLYHFIFQGPYSYSLPITGTDRNFGVIHLDETIYMFRSQFPTFESGTVYANVTDNLIEFFVSFAKTGRPTTLSQDAVRNCTSASLQNGTFCDYQEFANSTDANNQTILEVRTRNAFNTDMIEFWDEIFELAARGGSLQIQWSLSVTILGFVVYLNSLL